MDSYSVLAGTMADMTYEEIETAAAQQACVLFPVGVMEEHGPHMCLGVDTYLTYALCRQLADMLEQTGKPTLIAPPYYWGINHANAAFPGSFTVRDTTMIAVLVDTLVCLKKWGFNHIFLINLHGDFLHNKTIYKAVREARQEHGVGAQAVLAQTFAKLGRAEEPDDSLLFYQIPLVDTIDGYIDLHAGANETAWMYVNFPALINVGLARTLVSSKNRPADLIKWGLGGQSARRILPRGYCGDPSKFDPDKAQRFQNDLSQEIFAVITANPMDGAV